MRRVALLNKKGVSIFNLCYLVGAPGHPLRLRGLREGHKAAHEPAHSGLQGGAPAGDHGRPAGEAAHRRGAFAAERTRREEGSALVFSFFYFVRFVREVTRRTNAFLGADVFLLLQNAE